MAVAVAEAEPVPLADPPVPTFPVMHLWLVFPASQPTTWPGHESVGGPTHDAQENPSREMAMFVGSERNE